MPAKQTPVLVKHCALAIHKSGYCSGQGATKAQQALDIAISRLIQYGFLWKGADQGEPEQIKLTTKGRKAERRHRRESGAKAKTDEWNALYGLIQEDTDEGEDSESQDAEPKKPGESLAQRRRRQTKAKVVSARRAPKRAKRAKKAKRR